MKALARSFVWWPGIDLDIEESVRLCEVCTQAHHSPLMHHDLKDLGLICLVKKCKIHLRILSDFRIQSSIFLKKHTLSHCQFIQCPPFTVQRPVMELVTLVHTYEVISTF